jgi:hypothetical protein
MALSPSEQRASLSPCPFPLALLSEQKGEKGYLLVSSSSSHGVCSPGVEIFLLAVVGVLGGLVRVVADIVADLSSHTAAPVCHDFPA